MFKDWLKKLKVWVLGRVEAALLKKVEELDAYESELADLVKLHVDPDQRTKQVVDFVQEKLTVLVIKALILSGSAVLSSTK